ncbi:MAG: glycosyltransferase family 4 protein [Candidatus Methanoperedens sp.]|nr:glycosyltransferase family 4 protein [Candidatus Methanoperedens sp.]
MKIALLVPNFVEYSGDAIVVNHQAEDFISKGHDVTIFAFASNFKPKNADIEIMGMPKSIFWQRVYRLFFPLDIIKTIKWLPKLKEYDCVIAHLSPMTWLGYLGKKFYHFKYIFWYHGIEDPDVFKNFHEKIYMHMHLALTKYTIKNADKIVSVSNFARKNLISLTGFESEVVYNEINTTKFNKDVNPSIIRKELNLEDNPVILSVGRIAPQKGFHLLIEAFDLIKKDVSNAKLVIVGKFTFDDYGAKLKQMSDESVIFTGPISNEEIPFYYSMCNLYATCSLWENHNIPVLEAQACGKPVIAFDIDSFVEEVDENGILVEKGNVEKLAEACIRKLRE